MVVILAAAGAKRCNGKLDLRSKGLKRTGDLRASLENGMAIVDVGEGENSA